MNGNVTNVNRGSAGFAYDQISITYDGNHIVDITDNSLTDDYMGEIPQLAMGDYLESLDYDALGRVTRDDSRGITNVIYNPLHLPQIIRFETGDLLTSSYRADGVKTSINTRHRYTEAVKRYDRVTGDTIIVNVNRVKSVTRRYTGKLMEETGKADRLYNEVGYIDIYNDGTYSYHYYIKDIWGSIRAVIDANGCIEQADDYTDSGIPYNSNPLYAVDNRKHTGKEFEAFDGLAWYDNNARWYDPILVRFITMDPMSEDYYNMSPYSHCAGNPIRYIDPTGEYFKGIDESIVMAWLAYYDIKVNAMIEDILKRKKLYQEVTMEEQELCEELLMTISDLNSMKQDEVRQYTFDFSYNNNNQEETIVDEMNPNLIKIYYQIYNIGSWAHEIRHGGQIARGELYVDYSNYSCEHEVSAYRAQYANGGSFEVSVILPELANIIMPIKVRSLKTIDCNFINRIYENNEKVYNFKN